MDFEYENQFNPKTEGKPYITSGVSITLKCPYRTQADLERLLEVDNIKESRAIAKQIDDYCNNPAKSRDHPFKGWFERLPL